MPYLLVIEDDADTRALIRLALRKEAYTVSCCGSAAEALKHLETSPAPNLILLDLTLPDMTGDEFMKILRDHSKLSSLKVMICSGWDNLEQRAALIGADGWLSKPFEIAQLSHKLSPFFT